MVAAAVAAVAAVGAAASSSDAARKSAHAQQDAAKAATEGQLNQYQQGVSEVAPFKQIGISALDNLGKAANDPVTPFAFRDSSTYLNDYFNSPEYNVLNKQASDQILRGASATGGLRSGSSSVNLANIAPTLGINALNRTNQQDLQAYGVNQGAISDRFNRLYGVANMGANAASGNQNSGNQVASQAGSNALAAGNAQAMQYQQQNQAVTGVATDLASLYLGNRYGVGAQQQGISNDYTGSAYKNWVNSQAGKP
jgi:hypothetical protein